MDIKTKTKEKKSRWWIFDVVLEIFELMIYIPRFVLHIVLGVYR